MLNAVIDLLLPPRCLGCVRPSPIGLCPTCRAAAEELALPDGGRVRLADGIVAVGAYAYDGVVRDAIRALKAGGCHAAAAPLGRLLAQRVGVPPATDVARTWVPSSRARLRERGVELTRGLAGPGAVDLLRRTSHRPDQTALTASARRASPAGSFVARGAVPRAVVLIDDVRTTGATALAAGGALRAAGAQRVLVATLAVGGREAQALASSGAMPSR